MGKHKTAGKSDREGISLAELFKRWPTDEAAEAWFVARRWPHGVVCPHCGSTNVQSGAKHKTMPYRCREKECAKRFSAKTGTVMEGSKLGFQTWMIATYLLSTNLKSVSSMKLHRDLSINQRSAWFLAHRLRVALADKQEVFGGPVEVDESYFGGRQANMPRAKRRALAGGGTAHMTAVVGMKDRDSNEVRAEVVTDTTKPTLQGFVREHAKPGAAVYTDEHRSYVGLGTDFDHETVNHRVGEYVDGMIHIQGMESFWSMLKRAHKGTFHKVSPKHLQRYVDEFAGRHNVRDADTIDIMATFAAGTVGKRLRYRELIADNGLPSGARS